MNKPKIKEELSIIQHTYDLIKWYIITINKFPRDHKFALGDRLTQRLYELLEGLIEAKYCDEKQLKRSMLKSSNRNLGVIRYQTRLLKDFELLSVKKYAYINEQLDTLGAELGNWLHSLKDSP